MQIRLFPAPTSDVCTPYCVAGTNGTAYERLYDDGKQIHKTNMRLAPRSGDVVVKMHGTGALVRRYRLPNHSAVLAFLRKRNSGSTCKLHEFATQNMIVPAFSLSVEEAAIKAVIRQVVSAQHAKKLISEFIVRFGPCLDGLFGFPSGQRLARYSKKHLRDAGLGMKVPIVQAIVDRTCSSSHLGLDDLKGLGPWTKAVIQTDLSGDFSHYPLDDKSGEKMKSLFGLNLPKLALDDPSLAADLYVYAGAYLESIR